MVQARQGIQGLNTIFATASMEKEWEKAIVRGDIREVRVLVESGININSLDRYGQTAIMKAAHSGHLEIVDLLIKRGADLNHTAKFGLSALMLAVIGNHPGVVKILIAAGANPNLRGSERSFVSNRTALEIADQMGHALCAEILRNR